MENEKKSNQPSSKKKSSNSALANFYLIIYNVIQTAGWSLLMYQTITHLLDSNPKKESLYDKVSTTLIIFQNLAMLEVVHAALRLVPSSIQVTLQQIASRVIVVCGVLMITQTPRESIGFPLLLFAWGITEIIRYSNYAFNLIYKVPYFLLYLRYTTFYVLYPIGVTGELLTLYCTFQETSTAEFKPPFFSDLFICYPYLILGIMFLYLPLFPQMYYHMIKQRRKQLGAPISAKKTK